MSREDIIIRLLQDYEYLIDDSDYCRISEIRSSISYLEDKIKERIASEMCAYINN